ncbi:hypothetical protein JCM3774_005360 [Rhodotorula dairenensis]
MSGISFRIQAPPRPTAGSSASTQPPSRSTSRSTSARADDDSDEISDGETRQDSARNVRQNGSDGSRRKRAKLLGDGDEEVVEYGADGARSKHVKASTGPLVIAALPNKDWRKAAEELRAGRNSGRRKQLYIPESAGGGMSMQRDGSTRPGVAAADVDAINTEEVVGGLSARPALPPSGRTEEAVEQVRQEVATVEVSTPGAGEASPAPVQAEDRPPPPPQALTEEQRALRELLGHEAAATAEQVPDAIFSAPDDRGGPLDETEAFKRDVDTRPDEASLDDYARVPVGQFGMAMLRGMGWQPGQAASRSGRGAIEAHVPASRPSLLGIGAKPMTEALGTGNDAKGRLGGKRPARTSKHDDMRFVPLMKRERDPEGAEPRRDSADPSVRGDLPIVDAFLLYGGCELTNAGQSLAATWYRIRICVIIAPPVTIATASAVVVLSPQFASTVAQYLVVPCSLVAG